MGSGIAHTHLLSSRVNQWANVRKSVRPVYFFNERKNLPAHARKDFFIISHEERQSSPCNMIFRNYRVFREINGRFFPDNLSQHIGFKSIAGTFAHQHC